MGLSPWSPFHFNLGCSLINHTAQSKGAQTVLQQGIQSQENTVCISLKEIVSKAVHMLNSAWIFAYQGRMIASLFLYAVIHVVHSMQVQAAQCAWIGDL